MSKDRRIYTSIDIGSTSVKVIIAEVKNSHISILGVGDEVSRGIKRGVIVDMDQTVEAVRGAVRQAEEKAGIEVTDVIVGVPNHQLDIIQSHGVVEINDPDSEITEHDVEEVLRQLMVQAIPPEKQVMSVLAEEFVVDGFNDIQDPRGMIGVRLELYGFILSLPKTVLQSIVRVVERAGFTVSHLVSQSLALSSIALTDDEQRTGAVVIDLGGGQTTAAALHDNKLKFATVDPEGGNNVTRDIATVLNIPVKTAEQLKRSHGFASSLLAEEDNNFTVQPINNEKEVVLSEKYLAEIIEARFIQIIETIKPQLDEIEALELPSSVVISGGGAMLPGVKELFEEFLDKSVKIYTPNYMGIRHSTFSTAIGLINYISEREEIHAIIDRTVNANITNRASRPEINRNQTNKEINEEPVYDSPSKENRDNDESFIDKIKTFFNSFFE